jgi:hypothetical protein
VRVNLLFRIQAYTKVQMTMMLSLAEKQSRGIEILPEAKKPASSSPWRKNPFPFG